MNWTEMWMNLFNRTELLGQDMGFWVSMAVVAIVVVIQHIVFWGIMKPKKG